MTFKMMFNSARRVYARKSLLNLKEIPKNLFIVR